MGSRENLLHWEELQLEADPCFSELSPGDEEINKIFADISSTFSFRSSIFPQEGMEVDDQVITHIQEDDDDDEDEDEEEGSERKQFSKIFSTIITGHQPNPDADQSTNNNNNNNEKRKTPKKRNTSSFTSQDGLFPVKVYTKQQLQTIIGIDLFGFAIVTFFFVLPLSIYSTASALTSLDWFFRSHIGFCYLSLMLYFWSSLTNSLMVKSIVWSEIREVESPLDGLFCRFSHILKAVVVVNAIG